MSLISMPFVGSGTDLGLHVAAAVVMVGVIGAALVGFWKFHEIPMDKAHKSQHQQIGLITALTWIGFIWHWVWVLAVIIAFADFESAVRKLRDIWHPQSNQTSSQAANSEVYHD